MLDVREVFISAEVARELDITSAYLIKLSKSLNLLETDFSKIKCKKLEDINSILSNFNNYYDREMYTFFAEYNNGYLILNCYLVVPNNAIEKYELFSMCSLIMTHNQYINYVNKSNC